MRNVNANVHNARLPAIEPDRDAPVVIGRLVVCQNPRPPLDAQLSRELRAWSGNSLICPVPNLGPCQPFRWSTLLVETGTASPRNGQGGTAGGRIRSRATREPSGSAHSQRRDSGREERNARGVDLGRKSGVT